MFGFGVLNASMLFESPRTKKAVQFEYINPARFLALVPRKQPTTRRNGGVWHVFKPEPLVKAIELAKKE